MLPFQAVASRDCQELPYFRGGVSLGKLLSLEHEKLKFRTTSEIAWKDYYGTNLSFPVCWLHSTQEYIYLNSFSENCTFSSHSKEVFKFYSLFFFFSVGKGSLHSNHKCKLCGCIGYDLKLVVWVYYHSDVENHPCI